MLLRHTPKQITERQALTINPAKTCQPVGAMYAALGIHRCMPHSHGSQGCCAYHRSSLTRHYNDPIISGTSSFSEGASVFGGQANLLEAFVNIFSLYNPDIIAVNTTCLSEVIGDDLTQIIRKGYDEKKIPAGKTVIHANTPSFTGSHVTGFANMTKGMVKYFAAANGKGKNGTINLIPSFIEPSDMAEIKRIAREMEVKFIMYPDTCGVVDTPLDGQYRLYPNGGCRKEWIIASGNSHATLAMGWLGAQPAAKLLDTQCKVPFETVDLPLGISAADRFVNTLRELAGTSVTNTIQMERGRLVDAICDMTQYTYGKTVSLVGDPDILVPMAEFCNDIGMRVLHIVTGTPPGKYRFSERIKEICGENVIVRAGSVNDMFLFHQLLQSNKPDLIMGNTYCKYIARDLDIPLLRIGFPIYDRIGHSYEPIMGYKGGLSLFIRMLNILMDRIDRNAEEENFELIM